MGGMHAHVILAAGQGTRMRSRLPKVLHPLLGKPMLLYAREAALALKPERLVVVVGHGGEKVVEALEGSLAPVSCLEDPESCDKVGRCSTELLWRRVDLAMRQVLGGTTLKDLIEERRLLEARGVIPLEARVS